MAMTEIEAAWLAGVLEGDGCFSIMNNKTNTDIVRIQCAMSDRDIVERVASLMSTIATQGIITKGHKQMWEARIAKKEIVKEVCLRVLPYMGIRRSSKILEILEVINRKDKENYLG